jgi:enoyl-CoA hydratase/carnithine racemase
MTSYLLMTGIPITAERAYQLGLICELTEVGGAESKALEIAAAIAAQPPLTPVTIKRMLASGADLPLAAATALDYREFLLMFDTEDQKEGMGAALAGRTPIFKGR